MRKLRIKILSKCENKLQVVKCGFYWEYTNEENIKYNKLKNK